MATLLWLREHGVAMPSMAIVNSGSYAEDASSHSANQAIDVSIGSGDVNIYYFLKTMQLYAQGADLKSPYIYSINGNFKDLPPVYITVGTDEVLFDDSEMLAKKLCVDGVENELYIAEGLCTMYL